MSKITPKNLSYDTTLPPFLQRLQANNSSRDDRNEFQSARPKKARNPEDEAEDEPVYFDEETGETLSRREWEEKEKAEEVGHGGGGDGNDEKGGADGEGAGDVEAKLEEKERIAAIGGARKRKAGRVIDGGDREEGDVLRDMRSLAKGGKGLEGKRIEVKSTKKKGKKIKLSFGDDE